MARIRSTVFYSLTSGEYVHLPYRLDPRRRVKERVTCHGFRSSQRPDGALSAANSEPQKHHQIQLRQTPFYQTRDSNPPGKTDGFLYNVGNKEVVRCLAEGNERCRCRLAQPSLR